MQRTLLSKWPVLLTVVICTIVSSNVRWGNKYINDLLQADARGYYAYLPAIIIKKDFGLQRNEVYETANYTSVQHLYLYLQSVEGGMVNKYFVGTAMCELPFFLAAHAVAVATDAVADGYSPPYMIGISVAALSFLLLGLMCLDELLIKFGHGPWVRAIAILAICFGTNLFYYAVVEPGMSHIFSFGLMGLFLLSGLAGLENPTIGNGLIIGGLLGLIILVRPINLMIIGAVPVLHLMLKRPWPTFKSTWKFVMAGMAICLVVFSIQLIIYLAQVGSALVYSYGDQHLNLLQPHLIDFLSSYKKGFLLYTPLALLALVGFYPMGRKLPISTLWLAALLFAITYVLSSWEIWWYGGSFSARVMVEYLHLLALPLAALLGWSSNKSWRVASFVVLFALVALCQFQTYQYRYYRLHWENTDKAMYWDSFSNIGPK